MHPPKMKRPTIHQVDIPTSLNPRFPMNQAEQLPPMLKERSMMRNTRMRRID
jgi:hypothetical protein